MAIYGGPVSSGIAGAGGGPEVIVTVNGTPVTATYAPGDTAALTVVDSKAAAIGTLDIGTGAVTINGKWVQAFSHDLTAEATLDYDPATSPITLLGASWTQLGAAYADDVDLVNGTGLVVDMSASNSTFDTTGATMWHLLLDLDDSILFGADYDPDKVIAIQLMLGSMGDAVTELAGMFIANDLGATDYAGSISSGFSGATAAVVKHRQNGAVVTAGVVVATADCVMLIRRDGSWSGYYGTSSGGNFPAWNAWTQAAGSFAANIAANVAAGFATASDRFGLWAATGNTSNNFSPAFEKIRGYIVDSERPRS